MRHRIALVLTVIGAIALPVVMAGTVLYASDAAIGDAGEPLSPGFGATPTATAPAGGTTHQSQRQGTGGNGGATSGGDDHGGSGGSSGSSGGSGSSGSGSSGSSGSGSSGGSGSSDGGSPHGGDDSSGGGHGDD
jgi:hypothetical protein